MSRRDVRVLVLSETLALFGIALEMLGVALAALEYSGRDTFDRAQRLVRERLWLRYSPADFATRVDKNEMRLEKSERAMDRVAFSVATASSFIVLFAAFLMLRALGVDHFLTPLANWYGGLSSLYWSLLPAEAWFLAGVTGAVAGAATSKQNTRPKAVARKVSSIVFALAILPVIVVLLPYVFAFQFLAKRSYGMLHASIASVGHVWDLTQTRQGKPLLLVAAVLVMLGLTLQAAGVLAA